MSPYVRVIAGNRAVGRAINPAISQPWGPESEVRSMYHADLRWVSFKILHSQPVIGTVVRRDKRKTAAQLRRPDEDVVRNDNPEDQWIIRRPPVKDENGIPIPLPKKGRRPDFGVRRHGRMRINGRWHQWVNGQWVPMTQRVKGLWIRRGIPNDLQVRHGPWWPEGRQEVVNLTRRIEEKKPVPPTDQQSQDIRDLLEALGV